MEGRKTKHGAAKSVIHYLFFVGMVALTVFAYLYREDIENFFAVDYTGNQIVNTVLHYVPTIIISIQIVVLACVINFILTLLSKITFGLTDKGKTVVKLLNSLLKWVVIVIAILWILSVWGVNPTTLLAGAGIVALVIGLGAQSLIADVIAGIFIVLEGKYVVGDIVVVDGWRGKIIDIGIRTTELQDIGGNIKIINNSEIKSVINQTKMLSMANCYIHVASSASLENVERLIENNLYIVKEKIPAIKEDIIYKGIVNVTDVATELLFSAKCYEEDLYQVQRDLHRELKLLLDKHSIDSFAPPTYVIQQRPNQQVFTQQNINSQPVNPQGGNQRGMNTQAVNPSNFNQTPVNQAPVNQPQANQPNTKRPPQMK